MKGKSYLSIGSVSMGIAGSIVNPDFFRQYLGMRNEYVDMSEVQRRLKEGIYDPVEFEKALAAVKARTTILPKFKNQERKKTSTGKNV
jgi:L-fucose isomerase